LVDDGYEIALTFKTLDLEPKPDCLDDYVDISGAGRFCAFSELYGQIILRSKETRVRFVSNGSVQRNGFELHYEQVKQSRQRFIDRTIQVYKCNFSAQQHII